MLNSIRRSKLFKWVLILFIGLIALGLVASVIQTCINQENQMVLNNLGINIEKNVNKHISTPIFYHTIDSLIYYQQYDQAIKLTEIRKSNYPEDQAILNNQIGYIYFMKGDLVSSISSYGEAIKICDTLLIAYQNRGWAYLQMNKFDLAIKDFLFVSAIDVQGQYLLGMAFEKKGDFSDALKSYSIYFKYYPDNKECKLKIEELKMKTKR